MKGLTIKQQDLLDFIGDFTNTMHMSPTIYEIAAHLGVRPSTAFVHLHALCKKGAVTRSGKARSTGGRSGRGGYCTSTTRI